MNPFLGSAAGILALEYFGHNAFGNISCEADDVLNRDVGRLDMYVLLCLWKRRKQAPKGRYKWQKICRISCIPDGFNLENMDHGVIGGALDAGTLSEQDTGSPYSVPTVDDQALGSKHLAADRDSQEPFI